MIKKYWKWRFHFENYGPIEMGYFDEYGNGYDRDYRSIFQVPWDWVYKEKLEDDFKEVHLPEPRNQTDLI